MIYIDRSLPPSERIRKRADYVRIQGSGRKIASPNFLAFVVSTSLQICRIGITVSRRVGGAVVRNRVKRLIREAFRQQKPMFPTGLDIVIIARPEAGKKTTSLAQVQGELSQIGQRLSRVRSP